MSDTIITDSISLTETSDATKRMHQASCDFRIREIYYVRQNGSAKTYVLQDDTDGSWIAQGYGNERFQSPMGAAFNGLAKFSG